MSLLCEFRYPTFEYADLRARSRNAAYAQAHDQMSITKNVRLYLSTRIELKNMSADFFNATTWPACGHHVAVSFFDGGLQPLATIAWPSSSDEAQAMPKLPLSFVRCVDSGHVYNKAFEYAQVPYSDKPNHARRRAGR